VPAPARIAYRPLTPGRLGDLEALFGPKGACAGCWCMWWRIARPEWAAARGEGNRRALEQLVRGGGVPGILAYAGAKPVGWVAVEPRSAYPRLARSRNLKAVDDAPVWAITCFFVDRAWRGHGLVAGLVGAAVERARRAGAPALEAYPVETSGEAPDDQIYTGAASTFRRLGFEEVARRAPTRPLMRLGLQRGAGPPPRARASSRASTSAKRGSRNR
jgi:GNAT superfamily N-acetyltransferase